jgi:hypothetical protein
MKRSRSSEARLPRGSKSVDFASGQVFILPFDVECQQHFVARGTIAGMKFSGTFEASIVAKSVLGSQLLNMNGTFQVDFLPETRTAI